MSIAIQNQVISEIQQFIVDITEKEQELTWSEFVDKAAGDNDHLLAYLPILKSIDAMDEPLELMVQFSTLRGQFANSEDKFINKLVEAEFEDGKDYCAIDVDNEQFTEHLLFLSYNCLKTFIIDLEDKPMMRALMIGELMYDMYKTYSKSFGKTVSSKTHYMILEQLGGFGKTLEKTHIEMDKPEKVVAIITGSKAIINKHLAAMKKNPENWGNIIIPPTKAMYINALDDTKRIAKHVNDTIVKIYKDDIRAQVKAKKAKNKDDKTIKAPTTSKAWGVAVKSTSIMVNESNTGISIDSIIERIKAYFVSLLGQKHINITKMTHDEYLECVANLESERLERVGYFSAIRANAIHFGKVADLKKAEAKVKSDKEKAEKKSKKGDGIKSSLVATPNGFETEGSADEKDAKKSKATSKKAAKIETVEEEKPARKSRAKKASKVESDDEEEEKPAPKSRAKKAAKVESDDEEAKPARKTRGSRIKIETEVEEEKPVAKKVVRKARNVVEEVPDESESEASDVDDYDEDEEDLDDVMTGDEEE